MFVKVPITTAKTIYKQTKNLQQIFLDFAH
jgi:hypothetical protein